MADTPKRSELAVESELPPPHRGAAAGLPAVVNVMRYAAQTSSLVRGTQALLKVNQPQGFDCPGCAWPDPAHTATAEFCENGARAVLHETDSRRADALFFREHTMEALYARSDYWLEQQGRLVTPLILRPGSDHYQAIEYEAAFDIIGKAIRGLASPDEAIFYTSGRTSNEAAFLYQLLARSLGTNNLPDCSNMCHESSGKGLGSTVGVGKGTVSLADFDETDCIFILGQNPGTNHPRMLSTLAAARRRGATIVAINPLRERGLQAFADPQTASGLAGLNLPIASHHVHVRIGGDVALLKGIMKEVLALEDERPGVLARDFIDEHTTGFDALVRDLDATSWDAIVAESGIGRAAIRELAEIYARSERVIATWAMGLTQHKNGVGNVRSVVNLLLLRGNIGRPGAGACPVRGHSNVQGDRTMGIYESPTEAFLARLDTATGIVSPRAHGVDSVGAVQALEAGRAKIFMGLGGNFAAAMSDTARTAAALRQAELTVHVSTKLNRSHLETGRTAIILPCLGRTERDVRGGKAQFVTVEDSMSAVHASEGSLPPADRALLSEVAIVCGVALASLRGSPIEWARLAEDYDGVRELISRAIPSFEDYNARIKKGGFTLPNAVRERRWNTKSGRAEFTVQPLANRELRPGELLLMTIRSHDQFNTTLYGLDDRYRGIYGERRVAFVNRADLTDRGLADGDRLVITSRHGEETRTVSGFRAVAFDVPRGCVAAYYPETNPLVVLESYADESRTPASKSVIVTLAALT